MNAVMEKAMRDAEKVKETKKAPGLADVGLAEYEEVFAMRAELTRQIKELKDQLEPFNKIILDAMLNGDVKKVASYGYTHSLIIGKPGVKYTRDSLLEAGVRPAQLKMAEVPTKAKKPYVRATEFKG